MPDEIELYEIEYDPEYTKNFKRYVKKKKYVHLPAQIEELVSEVRAGKFSGTILRHQDNPIPFDLFKKRLPNPDARKGDSGGYRLLYLARHDNHIVAFLILHTKADMERASDAYIDSLMEFYLAKEFDAQSAET